MPKAFLNIDDFGRGINTVPKHVASVNAGHGLFYLRQMTLPQ